MKNPAGSRPVKAVVMRPFSRSLPMQLMRAREAVMRRFRPHLLSRGFSDQQWRIVRALVDSGRLEITALSAQCQIHPASLSRMLPTLARAGLIARNTDRADQRRVVVSITPRGHALFLSVAPESEEIYSAVERDFGAKRLGQLYRLLDRLIETLESGDAHTRPVQPQRQRKLTDSRQRAAVRGNRD